MVAVLTGKLGDVVCGTPLLRALRAHFPEARIIAAGAPFLPALLEDGALADGYVHIDAPDAEARVRTLKADAGVVTGPSFAAAAKLYLAGIPLVAAPRVEGGYSPFVTWPYRFFMPLVALYPYRMGGYAPRERLNALLPLCITSEDTTKALGYSEAARNKAEAMLKSAGNFVVGISATAGNKIKEWPPERFAQVGDHLIETHRASVVLLGGPQDHETARAVLKCMRHGASVINVQGKLNLDELKALISRLGLFIAVDTGPIYIAEAFGIPTIDIVGPMDEKEQPPRGPFNRNVLPPYPRVPQLRILNARFYDKAEAERQTRSITAEMVIREADALIRDILKR